MRPSHLASLLLVAQCGRGPSPEAARPRPVDPAPSVVVTPGEVAVAPRVSPPSQPCRGLPIAPRERQTSATIIPAPGAVVAADTFALSADLGRIVATRADGAAFVVGRNLALPARRLEGTPLPPRLAEDERRESYSIASDGRRVVGTSARKGDHGWEIRHVERVWDATTGAITSTRTVVLSGQRFVATPALDRRAILGSGYFGDAGYAVHLAGIPVATAARITSGKGLFHDAAWSPKGDRLAVTQALPDADLSNAVGRVHPGTLAMWRIDPPAKLFERALDDAALGGFIGEGALVVVRDGGRLRVLDAETGAELRALDAKGTPLPSAQKDILVTTARDKAASDGALEVFDLARGERRYTLALGQHPFALDPSGRRLAINGGAHLCVLDVDDGHTIVDLALPQPAHAPPEWSADGGAVIASGEEGTLLVDPVTASVTAISVAFGTR